MRRIDIENYICHVRDEEGEDKDMPYDVRNSLIECLLSRELRMTAREILDRDDLARMIKDSPDGVILLEESDWQKLVKAVETIKGWCSHDMEFLHRVLDAPEVEVEEKH